MTIDTMIASTLQCVVLSHLMYLGVATPLVQRSAEIIDVDADVEYELVEGDYVGDDMRIASVDGHGWEVLDGSGMAVDAEEEVQVAEEVRIDDAGVERDYGDDSYGATVDFGGYSGTNLCAQVSRPRPIGNHTNCPLERKYFTLWPPEASEFGTKADCWIDNIRAYQSGSKLNSAPGEEVRLGACKSEYDGKWHGGYDWRYGGIRPQDNPDMALYPAIAEYVEESFEKTGKKVLVKGSSGGTINSYAFLMSQSEAWRKKYVFAYVIMVPVFGGTISSINSILTGWARGAMTQCDGRKSAFFIPSVLWMFPRPGKTQYYWNESEPIVMTPSKNYTAADLPQMLTDMGLPKVRELLELEVNDYLMDFRPPMVDTYAFYGYGKPTQAGFIYTRDLSPESDGENICPPSPKSFVRSWDNGDGVGPLRSTARAGQWADTHAKAGVVLKNYGYQGMGHSCSTAECKKDYDCVMNKLAGKPHGDC